MTYIQKGTVHPEVLDSRLVDAIVKKTLPLEAAAMDARIKNAVLAFIYLYMVLASEDERPALNFTARSTLPIGAGLGSSAAYSTCVASALLLLHDRISIPSEPAPSSAATSSNAPAHVHVSHGGRRAIPQDFADEVNRWAFVSEKVLHGNPSGVDNSVAVYGGALTFVRDGFGRKGGLESIPG